MHCFANSRAYVRAARCLCRRFDRARCSPLARQALSTEQGTITGNQQIKLKTGALAVMRVHSVRDTYTLIDDCAPGCQDDMWCQWTPTELILFVQQRNLTP